MLNWVGRIAVGVHCRLFQGVFKKEDQCLKRFILPELKKNKPKIVPFVIEMPGEDVFVLEPIINVSARNMIDCF